MSPVRPLSILPALVLFLSSVGCGLSAGQRAAIENFSEATLKLTEVSEQTFTKTREDVIALRRGIHELRGGSVVLTDPANDLDGAMNPTDLEARLLAGSKIKEYALLLSHFANEDSGERIKASADSFLTGIQNFNGVQLSNDDGNAISALIGNITSFLVEAQKKKVLKRVIPKTRPAVDAVIDGMIRDFDTRTYQWIAEFHRTLTEIRSGSLRNDMSVLAAGSPHPRDRTGPNLTQADLDRINGQYRKLLADASQREAGINELIQKIHEALTKLRQANAALENKIKYEDFSVEHIQEYVSKAKEVGRLFRVLRGPD